MSSFQSAPLMSSTALQKETERARELFRRMDGVRSAWPAQLSSHSIRRNGGKSGTRHDSLTDRLAGEMDSKLVIEAKQEGRLARGFKGPRPEPLHFRIGGAISSSRFASTRLRIKVRTQRHCRDLPSKRSPLCRKWTARRRGTRNPALARSISLGGRSLCCTLNQT